METQVKEYKNYQELVKSQKEDVNNFPIIYLFGKKSDEELKKELEKIGAKSLAECTSLYGCGDVVKKEDVSKWFDMSRRHYEEYVKFLEKDENLEEAIYNEMNNHEYNYTYDDEDVIEALRLPSGLRKEERFKKAWSNASDRYLTKECFA